MKRPTNYMGEIVNGKCYTLLQRRTAHLLTGCCWCLRKRTTVPRVKNTEAMKQEKNMRGGTLFRAENGNKTKEKKQLKTEPSFTIIHAILVHSQ